MIDGNYGDEEEEATMKMHWWVFYNHKPQLRLSIDHQISMPSAMLWRLGLHWVSLLLASLRRWTNKLILFSSSSCINSSSNCFFVTLIFTSPLFAANDGPFATILPVVFLLLLRSSHNQSSFSSHDLVVSWLMQFPIYSSSPIRLREFNILEKHAIIHDTYTHIYKEISEKHFKGVNKNGWESYRCEHIFFKES